MRQLPVVRCKVCQAPFLFEASLVEHERNHYIQTTDLGAVHLRQARRNKVKQTGGRIKKSKSKTRPKRKN